MKLVKKKTQKKIEKMVAKIIKKHGPQVATGIATALGSALATLASTTAPGGKGKKSNLKKMSEEIGAAVTGDRPRKAGKRKSGDDKSKKKRPKRT